MSDVVKPADDGNSVTDSKGRVIKFRVMDPGDMLDITEMAGESSTNQGYLRYAMVAFAVTDIDGVPVPPPRNRAQMRELAKRVGNEGMVALTAKMFGAEAETQAIADAETIKN